MVMTELSQKVTARGGQLVGYARVSTDDQNCEIQIERLKAIGCKKIFSDQKSGKNRDRPELDRCLEYVRERDMLVITRIDRLGRSQRDLLNIAHELKQLKVDLYIAQQQIDTSTAIGKMFYSMLGMFAEFEYDLKRERQAEGIAKAKERGKYTGRKPLSDDIIIAVHRLKGGGEKPVNIARKLNIGRTSVYKCLSLPLPARPGRDPDTPDMFTGKTDSG